MSDPVLWLVPALGDTGEAYWPLRDTEIAARFDLRCVNLPGVGGTRVETGCHSLDGVADWLAGQIQGETTGRSLGLVGHSLGSAVAVRVARRLPDVVGVFSIEGNLTEADAYFSGTAASFEDAELFRQDLVRRVGELEGKAAPGSRPALERYRASLQRAEAHPLWSLARSARLASAGDGLGAEYRALGVPTLYYWSPRNTPAPTQDYVRKHSLRNVSFAGGHWPMQEQPEAVARELASFFAPLTAR